jgi:hypothetical protein
VHDDAAARIACLQASDLDREIRDPGGQLYSIRNALWHKLLMHAVHHRGQLMILCEAFLLHCSALRGNVVPIDAAKRRHQYEPNGFAGIAMHVWEFPPNGTGADAALREGIASAWTARHADDHPTSAFACRKGSWAKCCRWTAQA